MATNLRYCAVRYGLEERFSTLIGEHVSASDRLLRFVGINGPMFTTAHNECADLRRQIATCRTELSEHRDRHGC